MLVLNIFWKFGSRLSACKFPIWVFQSLSLITSTSALMLFRSHKRGNKEEIRGEKRANEREREREKIPSKEQSTHSLTQPSQRLAIFSPVGLVPIRNSSSSSAQIVKCARPSPLRWNELGRGAAQLNSLHSVALPTQHLTSSLLSTHSLTHSISCNSLVSARTLTFFAMDVRTLDPTGLY